MPAPLWLWKLGAMAVLALGIFLAGMAYQAHRASVADLKQQVQASEDNREAERLAGRNMTRISDALTKDRLATALHAAGLERRLRDLAESGSDSAPGCPGRNDDARPAAAVLSDDARSDLVALAQEADSVADRLRACQAAAVIEGGGR